MDIISNPAPPPLDASAIIYHPTTVWHQNSKYVTLKIQLRGLKSIWLRVTSKQMLFWVDHEGKRYVLLLEFHDRIIPANSKHEILGGHVELRLEKKFSNEWPRLIASAEKLPYIKPDISAIEVEDEDKIQYTSFADIRAAVPLPPLEMEDRYGCLAPPEAITDFHNDHTSSDDDDFEAVREDDRDSSLENSDDSD